MPWIVCYKHYIQTVSLLNEVACVLLQQDCFENICHILCTCFYLCECWCESTSNPETNNVSHTECMNTSFLQSDIFHKLSLLNEFDCVLLHRFYFQNICHILCTYVCLCECSYDDTGHPKKNNVSHTDCMNTSFLQSDVFDKLSVLNEIHCALQDCFYFQNICHILCTCIYLCEYSYDYTRHPKMNNVSHIECMDTGFLQSDVFDELCNSSS